MKDFDKSWPLVIICISHLDLIAYFGMGKDMTVSKPIPGCFYCDKQVQTADEV